jgi:hypothetical protein
MQSFPKSRLVSAGAVCTLIACAAWPGAPDVLAKAGILSAAQAQTHGSGGSRGQGASGGHDGGRDDGHDDTDHGDEHLPGGKGRGDDAGGEGAGRGKGQGGEGEGGRQAGRDGRSGLPVWAREGIPEVELGRLNVARSPDRVLDRAFEEAKSSFSAETARFYQMDLDGMIAELSLNWDNVDFIDSPLQNLALLRDALGGASVLRQVGVTTDIADLQAVFLGTASDKEIPITAETALAISTILGLPLTQAEAEALARDAEAIRIAILAGHG